MRKVIKHPKIGTVLKCMGSVIVYDSKCQPYDWDGKFAPKPPRICNRLFKLAEMDPLYESLTGHPLHIDKKDGVITELREW